MKEQLINHPCQKHARRRRPPAITIIDGALFILLIINAAAAATAEILSVDYRVINNATNTKGGSCFERHVGHSYAEETMSSATNFILRRVLRQADRNDVVVRRVILLVTDDSKSSACSVNRPHRGSEAVVTVCLSAGYVGNYTAGNVKKEVTGLIFHEIAHVWQWTGDGKAPAGLVEGVADFVRLEADLAPGDWARAGKGERWDQGYNVTARFLGYCEGIRDGFVAELNERMRYDYSDGYFLGILGKPVDQLWKDYKSIK